MNGAVRVVQPMTDPLQGWINTDKGIRAVEIIDPESIL
jgi:hypothetical protein